GRSRPSRPSRASAAGGSDQSALLPTPTRRPHARRGTRRLPRRSPSRIHCTALLVLWSPLVSPPLLVLFVLTAPAAQTAPPASAPAVVTLDAIVDEGVTLDEARKVTDAVRARCADHGLPVLP